MAAVAGIPVFMRIGTDGAFFEVGTVELKLKDTRGVLIFEDPDVPRLLRAMADELDRDRRDSTEVPDAAPR